MCRGRALPHIPQDVVLEELELRCSALNALLPLGWARVIRGYVKVLRLKVPWTRLLEQPLVAHIRCVGDE